MRDFLKTRNFVVAVAFLTGTGLATLYHEIEARKTANATSGAVWYLDVFHKDQRILYGEFDTRVEAEQYIKPFCEHVAAIYSSINIPFAKWFSKRKCHNSIKPISVYRDNPDGCKREPKRNKNGKKKRKKRGKRTLSLTSVIEG